MSSEIKLPEEEIVLQLEGFYWTQKATPTQTEFFKRTSEGHQAAQAVFGPNTQITIADGQEVFVENGLWAFTTKLQRIQWPTRMVFKDRSMWYAGYNNPKYVTLGEDGMFEGAFDIPSKLSQSLIFKIVGDVALTHVIMDEQFTFEPWLLSPDKGFFQLPQMVGAKGSAEIDSDEDGNPVVTYKGQTYPVG